MRKRCGTYKRSHPEGSAHSHGTESCANKLESAKNTSSDKKHGPLAGQHGTELSGARWPGGKGWPEQEVGATLRQRAASRRRDRGRRDDRRGRGRSHNKTTAEWRCHNRAVYLPRREEPTLISIEEGMTIGKGSA